MYGNMPPPEECTSGPPPQASTQEGVEDLDASDARRFALHEPLSSLPPQADMAPTARPQAEVPPIIHETLILSEQLILSPQELGSCTHFTLPPSQLANATHLSDNGPDKPLPVLPPQNATPSPPRPSLDSDTTLGRYDSVRSVPTHPMSPSSPTLWPSSLALRGVPHSPLNTSDATSLWQTLSPVGQNRGYPATPVPHPPKPTGGVVRRSKVAEQAPEVVNERRGWDDAERSGKWDQYDRQDLGFVSKTGFDTPIGKEREREREKKKEVRFENESSCGKAYSHQDFGGYRKRGDYDETGDFESRGGYPIGYYHGEGNTGMPRMMGSSRQDEKRAEKAREIERLGDTRKCMGWRGVTSLVFAALLIGGAISGGLVLAFVKKPDSPIAQDNSTSANSTSNVGPTNITSATTCLCCTSSSPLTYISPISATSQFQLNCSSNLGPSPGAQSLDLSPCSVTTSFAICMDMCVAWNRNQDLINKEGMCGGVSWLVQTGKVDGGNLLCTLKRRDASWVAWTGGSRGLSALLNS